jgi:hypothetical protein
MSHALLSPTYTCFGRAIRSGPGAAPSLQQSVPGASLSQRSSLVRTWCVAAPARCSAPLLVSHVLVAVIPFAPTTHFHSRVVAALLCLILRRRRRHLSTLVASLYMVVGLRMDCEMGIELYEGEMVRMG